MVGTDVREPAQHQPGTHEPEAGWVESFNYFFKKLYPTTLMLSVAEA